MAFKPDHRFDSLTEAYTFIFEQYALRAPDYFWQERRSSLVVPCVAPKFIFRGECGDFPTTISAARRPSTYDLAVPLQELLRLAKVLIWRFQQSDFELDEQSSLALLQHYGFPTTIVDFTGHLTHAFAFAAEKASEVARVAVMPRDPFVPPARVVDLTEHEWAERPRRQAAFGLVMPPGLTDLKSDSARSRLSITWYEFPVQPSDSEFFREKYQALIWRSDDPSAGFIRFFITEYVEAHGKLSSALTEWLLRRIPMAPQCYLIRAFDGTEVVVNYRGGETLGLFDETVEADYSRKYWSGEQRSWERMRNWAWPPVGELIADPRTWHPEFYARP